MKDNSADIGHTRAEANCLRGNTPTNGPTARCLQQITANALPAGEPKPPHRWHIHP